MTTKDAHETVTALTNHIALHSAARGYGESHAHGVLIGIVKELAANNPKAHQHLKDELARYQRLNKEK
jgi:hypothetical protein